MAKKVSQLTASSGFELTDLLYTSKVNGPGFVSRKATGTQVKSLFDTYYLSNTGEQTLTGSLTITEVLTVNDQIETDFIVPLLSGYVDIENLQLSNSPHFSFADPDALLATDSLTNVVSVPYTSSYSTNAVVFRDETGGFEAGSIGSSAIAVTNTGINATVTITTSTTGAANAASLNLVRGDQADGYAQIHYLTGASEKWAIGLREDNDSYHFFTLGTTEALTLTTAGQLTALSHMISQASLSGAEVSHRVINTSNTANSTAVYRAEVGGASAGDPRHLFTVSGVQDWAFGIDNSDGDSFKITPSDSLGAIDALTIDIDYNIVPGFGALLTDAEDGFIYMQSCAGAPTGTPTAYTGRVPLVVDTTNGRLYLYYGAAWHFAALI